MKVSVVIPTFNCEQYVGCAILSALGQSIPPHEVIVIDDGSTDQTPDVLAQFGSDVTVLNQPNAGVSGARNSGIAFASGELIAFLDADDVWYEDKLAHQIQFLRSHPAMIGIFTDFALGNADGQIFREKAVTENYMVFSRYQLNWETIFQESESLVFDKSDEVRNTVRVFFGRILTSLFMGNFINTSSLLVSRRHLLSIGGFDSSRKTQEDYECWLKLAALGEFGYIDRSLVLTRRRANQLTNELNAEEILLNSLGVVESAALEFGPQLDRNIVSKRLSDKNRDVGFFYFKRDDMPTARKHFRMAIGARGIDFLSIVLMFASYLPQRLALEVLQAAKRVYINLKLK